MAMTKTCSGPECTRKATRKGLCDSHRMQQRRGRPLTPILSLDLPEGPYVPGSIWRSTERALMRRPTKEEGAPVFGGLPMSSLAVPEDLATRARSVMLAHGAPDLLEVLGL